MKAKRCRYRVLAVGNKSCSRNICCCCCEE